MFRSFGWIIIAEKSQLTPFQKLEYLGIHFKESRERVPSREEDFSFYLNSSILEEGSVNFDKELNEECGTDGFDHNYSGLCSMVASQAPTVLIRTTVKSRGGNTKPGDHYFPLCQADMNLVNETRQPEPGVALLHYKSDHMYD